MKKYLPTVLLILALVVPSAAFAATLTCNAYPASGVQPDNFIVRIGSQSYDSPPVSDGTGGVVLWQYLNDIVPVGTTPGGVTACKTYPPSEWYEGGPRCSSETPFDFTRPADPEAPSAPSGVGIVSDSASSSTVSTTSTSRGSMSGPTGLRKDGSWEKDGSPQKSGTKSSTLKLKR